MFRRLGTLASIAALSGLVLSGAVDNTIASAVVTGSISGVVSYSSTGVSGVCVTATGASTGSVITATTAAGGAYTLMGVTPDNYTVYFDPSCAGTVSSSYAWQYYNGVTPEASATAVPVTSGASVANINASLTLGSTIEGSVTGTGGTAVAGVCVEFYLSISSVDGEYVGKTQSANTGTYELDSFPDGEYWVRFDPTCATSQSSPYAVQDYSGQPDLSTATLIDITSPDSTASGINAALVPGASISGTVSVPGATSPANVCVQAYAAGYLESVATTNSAGTFDILNLPGDSYKIKIDPTCLGTQTSDFAVNWYNDAASFAAGSSFTLLSGGSLTGINASVALDVPAVAIATSSIPSGSTTSAYSATVQAAGGTGPYTWAASGLPAGLSIDATTGVISGTPSAGGNFTVAVTATDSSSQPVSATGSYSLSISQPAVVTTTTTVPPQTETVCSDKTKTETIRTTEVKNGKKIIVVTHKKVRLYKTVTIRKVEKIKGKTVVVITHKSEAVKVCKTVLVS